MKGPFHSVEAAEQEFKKKFSDKTKNKWEDREKFTPVPGKYTLLEMDDDDDDVSMLCSILIISSHGYHRGAVIMCSVTIATYVIATEHVFIRPNKSKNVFLVLLSGQVFLS